MYEIQWERKKLIQSIIGTALLHATIVKHWVPLTVDEEDKVIEEVLERHNHTREEILDD